MSQNYTTLEAALLSVGLTEKELELIRTNTLLARMLARDSKERIEVLNRMLAQKARGSGLRALNPGTLQEAELLAALETVAARVCPRLPTQLEVSLELGYASKNSLAAMFSIHPDLKKTYREALGVLRLERTKN